MNATHTLKREIVWAGHSFPAGTVVDANTGDVPRSGGYFFVKAERDGRAWFLSTTNDNLEPLRPSTGHCGSIVVHEEHGICGGTIEDLEPEPATETERAYCAEQERRGLLDHEPLPAVPEVTGSVTITASGQRKIAQAVARNATAKRDLLELINDALNASNTSRSIECVDEITRRLDMIDGYGGTEASNIKAILATGRPFDGYHPSDRGPLKSCPACRSKDPAVRLNPGGFICDDPSRFHEPSSR